MKPVRIGRLVLLRIYQLDRLFLTIKRSCLRRDLLSENTDILQSSKKILKIEVSRSQFRQNLNIVIPRKIMIIINRKVSKSNDETYTLEHRSKFNKLGRMVSFGQILIPFCTVQFLNTHHHTHRHPFCRCSTRYRIREEKRSWLQ